MVLPTWGSPRVSHHNPLTTVVYKVQMSPVDSSDAQMSNPVTVKHTSCQVSLILPAHIRSSLGSWPSPSRQSDLGSGSAQARRSRCLCTASVGGEGGDGKGRANGVEPERGERGSGRRRGGARVQEGDFRWDGVVVGKRVSLGMMREELWAWSWFVPQKLRLGRGGVR